jgi:hypothetical protein
MAKKDLPAVDFQAVLARRDPKLAERLAREGIAPEPPHSPAPPLLVAVPSLPATSETAPDVPLQSAVGPQFPSADQTAPKEPRKRGLVPRADGREAGRITVYVPPELALRLRKHCFERDRTMTDVAGEVLVEALERRLLAD